MLFFEDNLDYIKAFSKFFGVKEGIKALQLYAEVIDCSEYLEIYQDAWDKYQTNLNKYAWLAKDLKIDNSLELAHLFAYLLWNGYLSSSKVNTYSIRNRMMIPNMHAFDVVNGIGCCLEYSEFLRDFLRVCGKKASMIGCRVPDKLVVNYILNIDRKVIEENGNFIELLPHAVMLKKLLSKTSNHMVTLIEDDERLYLYDVTNLCVLNFDDKMFATTVDDFNEYRINLFSTLRLFPNCDQDNLFEKILEDELLPRFSREDVIVSYEKVMKIIQDNILMIEDAYQDIHDDLQFITDYTKAVNNINSFVKKKIKNKENK